MNQIFNNLLNLNRAYKISILLLSDIIISLVSIWITFNLISLKIVKFYEIDFEVYLLLSFTYILIQLIFKSYLKLSRFFSLASIFKLAKNFLIYLLILIFYKIFLYKGALIPTSNLFIYLIIFFLSILLKNSLLYNLYNYLFYRNDVKQKRVILFGFNQTTQNYIKNTKNYNFIIKGIFNENLNFYNKTNNKFELIDFNNFGSIYLKYKITDVLISDISSYRNRIYYYKKFLKYNVRVIFLNDVNNYLNLNNKTFNYRPDFDQLISHTLKKFDEEGIIFKNIRNKIILVAGGAGSIGENLVTRLTKHKPNKIIVVDKDEFEIFKLKKNLAHNRNVIYKLIDTTHYAFLNKIFEQYKPDYVFNAAAYKHVNIVEENLNFALFNNIKTAMNICKLSAKHHVKKNLLISTDKAVKPSNVMGLSKKLCEKIYLEFSKKKQNTILIVRFGNVVGSRGSVIPYFQNLIEKRLPLPLTSKQATRYLMSIKEACDLIIKTSIIGKNSGIYMLDMGNPVNIYDLTYKLIKFNGLSIKSKQNPHGDIEIKFTGLNKGEKLHEKLSYNSNLINTNYKKIMLCNEKNDFELNLSKIDDFIKNLEKVKNFDVLKKELKKIFIKKIF